MSEFLSVDIDSLPINEADLWNDADLQAELQSLLTSTAINSNIVPVAAQKPSTSSLSATVLSKSNEVDLMNADDIELDPELTKEYESLGISRTIDNYLSISTQNHDISDHHHDLLDFNHDEKLPQYDDDAVINGCTVLTIAKQNAVRHQKEGNTSLALKWYRRMNELKSSSSSMTSSSLSSSMVSSSTVSSSVVSSTTSSSKPKISGIAESFNVLEEALSNAEQYNLNEAKRLREIDPKEAVYRMKQYKYYNQELSVLRARRNLPGCLPPTFRWENKLTESKIENMDVGDDQMKMMIDGIYGLDPSYAGKSLMIQYYVGYSSNIEDALFTGMISSLKVDQQNNVIINNQTCMSIVKRGKTSSSSYLRKKAKFELFKTSFFSKKIIGVAIVSFTELSSKCETGGDISLTEDEKARSKRVGGIIRLKFKLRNPLSSIEKKIKEERVLVVDTWPDPTTTLVNESLQVISDTISSSSSASSSASSSKATASSDIIQLTEREITDPFAVEHLESNDVMEDELKQLSLSLSKGGLDETDKLVCNIRLHAIQSRLGLLQHRVGEGEMSLVDYLGILRQRVMRDHAIKNRLVSLGSKTYAMKIQSRIDMMQEEIKGAEENLMES